MNAKSLIHRVLWLLPVLVIFSSIFWLDHNRGGDLNRQMTCILSNSKLKNASDDVIIFGSSKSNTGYDHYYIDEILKFEGMPEDFNTNRYALFGRDNLSAYFLLENRIQNGNPPKIIALELMLGSRSIQARDKKLTARHNAILSFKQHHSRLKDFKRAHKNTSLLDYFNVAIERSNALIYGLIKHPGAKYWNALACTKPADWGRNASPTGEHKASGNAETEVIRAIAQLTQHAEKALLKQQAPNSKWKKDNKRFIKRNSLEKKQQSSLTSPIYNIDKAFSQREIKDINRILKLAKKHDTKIILVVMPSYYEILSDTEYNILQDTFPSAVIYDIYADARPFIDPYWKDLNHLNKEGSLLTSSLLARKIVQVLSND